MIILKEINPIGSGDDRVVYLHPTIADRCIKIPRVDFQNDFKPVGFNETLYLLSRLGQSKYFDFNYVDMEYADTLKKKSGCNIYSYSLLPWIC